MKPADPASPDRRGDADFLIEFLAKRDVPCPRCGYSLRALTADRCPECGDPLVLTVGLAEPKMGDFIGTLVALALGAGGGGLIWGIILLNGHWRRVFDDVPDALAALLSLRRPSRSDSEALWIFTLGLEFIASAAGLAALLWFRRRFRRLSPAVRRTICATVWAVVAVVFSGVVVFVR
jgi:hypothetical protein